MAFRDVTFALANQTEILSITGVSASFNAAVPPSYLVD